jgi:hypothetical protein
MSAKSVPSSAIARCRLRSLSAVHYRDDGTCLCFAAGPVVCLVHPNGLRLLDAPGRCHLYDRVSRCDFGTPLVRVRRGPYDRENE